MSQLKSPIRMGGRPYSEQKSMPCLTARMESPTGMGERIHAAVFLPAWIEDRRLVTEVLRLGSRVRDYSLTMRSRRGRPLAAR